MMIIIIIKIMNTPLWTIDIVFTVYGFQHRVKPQLQVYRWWWATKGIQWMANPSITSSRSRRVLDRVLCKSTSTSQLKGLDKVVTQGNGRLEHFQHQMKAQRGLWCESTKAFLPLGDAVLHLCLFIEPTRNWVWPEKFPFSLFRLVRHQCNQHAPENIVSTLVVKV